MRKSKRKRPKTTVELSTIALDRLGFSHVPGSNFLRSAAASGQLIPILEFVVEGPDAIVVKWRDPHQNGAVDDYPRGRIGHLEDSAIAPIAKDRVERSGVPEMDRRGGNHFTNHGVARPDSQND